MDMASIVKQVKNQTLLHEANYRKVLRVVPFLRSMHIDSSVWIKTPAHHVEIKILEVTKYTTAFSFTINYIMNQRWLPQIDIAVRCYHDASVAEVISFQRHKCFHSRYSYPNPKMYQKNEKQQINRFLSEWLNYCLHTQSRIHSNDIPISL